VNEKIKSIQALRGIAVLTVCAAHFLNTNNTGAVPHIVQEAASQGFLGVPLFFVISGFVLPLALSQAHYVISDFPLFVLKRLLRLEPAYLVSIALALALGAVASMTPGFHGRAWTLDWMRVLAHLGYIAPLVGKTWIVGVYWTLLVGAQFYLLIGVTYPLLRRWPAIWILALLIPCALTTSWNALTYHLPVFLIGTAAFAWRERWLTGTQTILLAVVTVSVLSSYRGMEPAVLALLGAAFILWARPKSRVLLFFGTISYSLYLVHLPIGRKVLNLLLRFLPGTIGAFASAAAALALSILVAWLMWRFVETPSAKWAATIRYERLARRSRASGGAVDYARGIRAAE
jgi:peptidoglycan/LPS O-acetylase OafA/YrhL